jgi:hypothetical protein
MSIGGIKFYNVSGNTGTSSIYLSTNNYLETNQTITSRIGFNAGLTGQATGSVAFGYQAGERNQSAGAVAFGYKSGQTSQGTGSVAIGYLAGQTTEAANAVAIGNMAGQTSQGTGSVAIGYLAGQTNEAANAVAIGNNAGQTNQGKSSVAIGYLAGQTNQGTNSIAIGNVAGPTGMQNNSIALNASGVPLSATGPTGGFYVSPIADYTNSLTIGNTGITGYFKLMMYGSDNQVVSIDLNALPYPITNVVTDYGLENTYRIKYDYPTQFLGGPFYLPFITTLNIKITPDATNPYLPNPLTITDQTSFCIKIPSNLNLNVTTTIYVFNSSNQYTNFKVIDLNKILTGPDKTGSGIYYIYIPPLVANSSTLSLSIWYSNDNGNGIITPINSINLMQTVYAPQSPNVSINGTVLSYLPTSSVSISNQIVTYTLDSTFQNFSSNTDIRFNKSNNPLSQNLTSYPLTKNTYNIFNELGLTPESSYSITVNAIGSMLNISSTKTTSTSLSITTPILTPSFYTDIMKIKDAVYNNTTKTISIPISTSLSSTLLAKSIQDDKNDYITQNQDFTQFLIPNIYLQNNIATRGTLSGTADLMSISLTCNRTNDKNFTITPPKNINATSDPIATFEGEKILDFQSLPPTLEYTITDNQTSLNLKGFYKSISFRLVLPNDTITASLSIKYLNGNYDSTMFDTIVFNYGKDTSLDHIYAGPYSNPSININTSSAVIDPSTTVKKICGISVVGDTTNKLTFNSVLKNISNIGKYYYNTNQIILYSFTTTPSSVPVTLSKTSLTKINQLKTNTSYFTKDSNENYYINPEIEISNPITTTISALLYFRQITLTTALYNPINSFTNYNFNIPVIYDTISTQTYRVSSLQVGEELVRPRAVNYDYSIQSFDNSVNLTTTKELLYTNGMYVTPGLNLPEQYYIDYSNTYHGSSVSNPDYSRIINDTSFRYATFEYDVNSQLKTLSGSFSKINITINNTSQEIINDNISNIISITNSTSNLTSKLLLFYRIRIDPSPGKLGPLNPDGLTPDNNGQTDWVDCNQRGNDIGIDVQQTLLDSNELFIYGNPDFLFDSSGNVSNTVSTTKAIIQRNLPYLMKAIPTTNGINPNYTIFIYVRIGIPMNIPFSFTDISIQLN